MNPSQFVDKWEKVELKERASAQSHFEDVCRLVGHPLPAEKDPKGVEFTYEYGVEKSGGGMGFADVWFDDHFAIETALYNFDGTTVYEKWLADHRDEQQPNGVLPDIIPTGGWGYGTANEPDWTSTMDIIPWEIYRFYGDSKLLADSYDHIRRYVDYVDRTSPQGLTSWGRGDWVPVQSHSNLELTSSVYFFVDATIPARAAKLFGKEADHLHYNALAEKIRNAINGKYLNRETGIYVNGTQTELSVPLQWKVVPEEMKDKVAANLAKKVEEAGFHLDIKLPAGSHILIFRATT